MLILTLILCFLLTLGITPLVKKLAYKVGATDQPNVRKVHQKIMPRLGGLAIYIGFIAGFLILRPEDPYAGAIILGSAVILLTGMADDIFDLSPRLKLLGQLTAAFTVVLGGVQIEFINLPFGGVLEFGMFSIPITILWIVGITNAINLIDGLDGLAAGVSTIGLATIGFMAMLKGDVFVMSLALILIVSTLGFLYFNFHPAKIFMGDTGALFLGYMIAVLSMLGFKNVTMISLIVPLIILGVPISDTFFAIIRRIVNKSPLSAPDKSHLHHCLLRIGFTHKQTVIIIYAIAAMFSLAAIIFSMSTLWGAMIVIAVLLIAIEWLIESIGLVNSNYQPLIKFVKARATRK
ncbi:glycosyltransferase family 4 protein [Rossellomorea aquimaris]|jgi:UDP-GlcNAc:undecaprenyl-phosphate/decaprenyl-phosphate GlcNAc-1-phosphate transferase|uniref:Undecaprenyl/decaprenyl-phosphate alpha-N-acetylglucosaminyl 1-phosphate transferase n=1 Tax=Rossellomorea aquimaris TaxID=189382 RepID=A0A5D4TKZ1_9BACI|nr:MraY family glycosyltransferase [Rossellomorea aquimaris]TYS76523.1 undecaprenyl/decaprenyl-phosphate alpha-N-acetylglucosaminyl 1-phosphate transferase [Rossellomorea aquimaris]TYS83113.1 undecaprenyl/decaprenyl-phosphate alpha-N-acetylglucosaminyl 1-phosphate transferase [Rossellomorea aquimaris]